MASLPELDAVIVGSGAGGAPLAARLASAGLRVAVLEAGRRHLPHEMPTDERAQAELFWLDERLSAGANPIGFGRNNSGCGVGGSTLHYTAYTPRPQPDDFRLRGEFGVGQDWPLGFEDIEPYLEEVEQFLGVSGPSAYPWGPPRRPYRWPPLPLNAAAQLMERGCAPLNLRTSPAANAALSRPQAQEGYGERPACTNRGFCQAGCSVGAKASMDVTYLALAQARGAEIRPESFVTGFRLQGDRVTGVEYVRDGREEYLAARHVFLCAGAVETPRLLLMAGLGNQGGQVGRNFMAHVGLQLWGQFEDETRPNKGIPGSLISEDTHRPQQLDGFGDVNFAGGYLLQSIGVMPVTYAAQFARATGKWGAALHGQMRGYNHVAGINILGECLPYQGNYLELSGELDARGLPKPRIHFTAGDNEKRMNAHAENVMRAIWKGAGARDIWTYRRYAHTIGTARMGADPASSVVNPDGRVHDLENLYISDNSTFPSSLSVNPALTIMALSLRTADRFLEALRSTP